MQTCACGYLQATELQTFLFELLNMVFFPIFMSLLLLLLSLSLFIICKCQEVESLSAAPDCNGSLYLILEGCACLCDVPSNRCSPFSQQCSS